MSFDLNEQARLDTSTIIVFAGSKVAVNDDGDRVLNGSWISEFSGPVEVANGQITYWERTGSSWSEVSQLVPDDQDTAYGYLGWAVAMDAAGETAVVTARTDGATTNGQAVNHPNGTFGSAFVFNRNMDGSWSQDGSRLGPSHTTTGTVKEYGRAAAMSADGQTMAISERVAGADDVVHVYVNSGGGWGLEQDLTAVGVTEGLAFAGATGDILFVGDGSASPDGEVVVYTRSAGVWGASDTVLPPAGDWLGFGVNLAASRDGLNLVVSQISPVSGGHDPGLFVYVRDDVGDSFAHDATLDPTHWYGTLSSYYTLAITNTPTLFAGPTPVTSGSTVGAGGAGASASPGGVDFFERTGPGSWSQPVGADPFSPSGIGDGMFGSSVAVTPDGNWFVGGGYRFGGGTFPAGAAWVYVDNAGTGAGLFGSSSLTLHLTITTGGALLADTSVAMNFRVPLH